MSALLLWMCVMMWCCPGLNHIGKVLPHVSADQTSRTILCFLGESVNLFTEKIEASEDWNMKNPDRSITKRFHLVTEKGENNKRYEYVNRTLTLRSVNESDAGLHEVEFFNKDGILVRTLGITLNVTCLKGITLVSGYSEGSVTVFPENLTETFIAPHVHWRKGGHSVASLIGPTPTYSDEYRGRVEMTTSGICTLLRIRMDDTGNHTLDIDTGHLRNRWVAQLLVTESQLAIQQTCLQDGKAEFRCSVTPPRTISVLWSLNGSLIGNSSAENSSEIPTLTLDEFSGLLFCTLEEYDRLNVSVSFSCMSNKSGPGAPKELYITIGASAIVLVIVVFSVYLGLIWRRKQQNLMSSMDIVNKMEDSDEDANKEEFPPPPPSLTEEDCVSFSPTTEMSTFID